MQSTVESATGDCFVQVLAGRQVVVDWAMAKARFTDAQAAGILLNTLVYSTFSAEGTLLVLPAYLACSSYCCHAAGVSESAEPKPVVNAVPAVNHATVPKVCLAVLVCIQQSHMHV